MELFTKITIVLLAFIAGVYCEMSVMKKYVNIDNCQREGLTRQQCWCLYDGDKSLEQLSGCFK